MITLVFFLSIYYYYINYHECANEIDNDHSEILINQNISIKYYFPFNKNKEKIESKQFTNLKQLKLYIAEKSRFSEIKLISSDLMKVRNEIAFLYYKLEEPKYIEIINHYLEQLSHDYNIDPTIPIPIEQLENVKNSDFKMILSKIHILFINI